MSGLGDDGWATYARVGQIEARPWTAEDEYDFVKRKSTRISISPADRETGAVHGLHGGMVARNPDNHEDQWYIAAEFFAKHYTPAAIPASARDIPREGDITISRDVADLAIRALHRDINYAHDMATYWYQKGMFASVEQGNSAHDYAKRCEAACMALRGDTAMSQERGE